MTYEETKARDKELHKQFLDSHQVEHGIMDEPFNDEFWNDWDKHYDENNRDRMKGYSTSTVTESNIAGSNMGLEDGGED